jgi:hypothetical protein
MKRDRDFFAYSQPVNWIVTNPPWSQIRRFLQHALSLADHVVFLMTINHLWTRARQRDIKSAGFGLREIVLFDTPKTSRRWASKSAPCTSGAAGKGW